MIDRSTPCNQTGCTNRAAYRFTWPGRDEAGICEEHRIRAVGIALAMGFPLQMIPLPEEITAEKE